MRKIYAVQVNRPEGTWETLYLATFLLDAERTLDSAALVTSWPIRLVSFTVADLEFIATYGTDYSVLRDLGTVRLNVT